MRSAESLGTAIEAKHIFQLDVCAVVISMYLSCMLRALETLSVECLFHHCFDDDISSVRELHMFASHPAQTSFKFAFPSALAKGIAR